MRYVPSSVAVRLSLLLTPLFSAVACSDPNPTSLDDARATASVVPNEVEDIVLRAHLSGSGERLVIVASEPLEEPYECRGMWFTHIVRIQLRGQSTQDLDPNAFSVDASGPIPPGTRGRLVGTNELCNTLNLSRIEPER